MIWSLDRFFLWWVVILTIYTVPPFQGFRREHTFNKKQSCATECLRCIDATTRCGHTNRHSAEYCECCRTCPKKTWGFCERGGACDPSRRFLCPHLNTDKVECKRMSQRLCIFNGVPYKSQTKFSISCRYNCHCLDGIVSCQDICRNIEESPPPPSTICPNGAELLPPSVNRCCREWACKTDYVDVLEDQLFRTMKKKSINGNVCLKEKRSETPWSACSKTCGMGISTRISTNNLMCLNTTQTRFCLHQYCVNDARLVKEKYEESCKPTIRSTSVIRIKVSLKHDYNGTIISCQSRRKFRPRTCNDRCAGCCRPIMSKTKRIEFECSDGKHRIKMYEWIQRCGCSQSSCP